MPKVSPQSDLKVGVFVSAGIALLLFSVLVIGNKSRLFSRSNLYPIHFQSVDGLIVGTKVVLSGVRVGVVEEIEMDPEKRDVSVIVSVARKYEDWIRAGSTAEVAAQGMLGDKFIRISQGEADREIIPPGSEIPNAPSKDITQFISKGDELFATLNEAASTLNRLLKQFEKANRSEKVFDGMAETARNLSQASFKLNHEMEKFRLGEAMTNLNSILEKVNNGNGTLGALVNDPALYDDAKALVGGANRSKIVRNLVRQTIEKSEKTAPKTN